MGIAAGPSRDERTMAMFCHLSSFAGYVVPFGNIIGPLVVWLIKREESDFVDSHGRQVLNFQLSLLIWFLVCIPLAFVIIGIFLAIGLGILSLVCTIVGAFKANDGKYYRYPLTIPFLK